MKLLAVIIISLISITPANAASSGGGSAPAQKPVSTNLPLTLDEVKKHNSAGDCWSIIDGNVYDLTTATPTPTTQATKQLSVFLSEADALIKQKNFTAALNLLKQADSTYANNADVNNLLGFSSRNLKHFSASARYYQKALRINPNHLGALEYQGELFLQTKKVSAAKKNLAKLKQLCGVNCEEYLDLKKAIGRK